MRCATTLKGRLILYKRAAFITFSLTTLCYLRSSTSLPARPAACLRAAPGRWHLGAPTKGNIIIISAAGYRQQLAATCHQRSSTVRVRRASV